jgi:hypothetical protein
MQNRTNFTSAIGTNVVPNANAYFLDIAAVATRAAKTGDPRVRIERSQTLNPSNRPTFNTFLRSARC